MNRIKYKFFLATGLADNKLRIEAVMEELEKAAPDLEKLKKLVSRCSSLNEPASKGLLINYAVGRNLLEAAAILLEKGATPGERSLRLAIEVDNPDLIQLLAKHDRGIAAEITRPWVLRLALQESKDRSLVFFLNSGTSQEGIGLSIFSRYNGRHLDLAGVMFREILAKSSPAKKLTALCRMAEAGNDYFAKIILEDETIDPLQENVQGWSPSKIAVAFGHSAKLADLFIEREAALKAKCAQPKPPSAAV